MRPRPRHAAGRCLEAAILVGLVATIPGSLQASDPLTVEHWLARCPEPERVLADAAAIAEANRRMLATEPSLNDLGDLPAVLPAADVAGRIERRGAVPDRPLVIAGGGPVSAADRGRWRDSLGLDAVPAEVEPRFALVVRRAAVRRCPTAERVLTDAADGDIDQFQETAFFPGTPVAALHGTADRRWWFVVGPTYDGWVAADTVAFGPRDEVLSFAARSSRVVTGPRVTTVFTPELPAASQVVLDMGTALPERCDWPAATPVNGQSAAGSVVVELPLREPDCSLRIAPALVPRGAATRPGPLPASRGAVLRQAFAFLGERYGWGHDFDGRDCSGLVCDVYRSLGILLPRNTRDQAVCPALSATPVTAEWPRERRIEALRNLLPGDLVFTRRHVMIVIGHDDGGPWVIHDTHEGRTNGAAANGVVVQTFRTVDGGAAIDRITAVVRVLPVALPSSPSPPPSPSSGHLP